MAAFSRQLLSGSTNGKCIKVVSTASPGTTIHTAVGGTTSFDEIYLWVSNTSSSPVKLSLLFGGVASPDDYICNQVTIPANSPPIIVVSGEVLQNALVVGAFADVANVLLISGYINRINA